MTEDQPRRKRRDPLSPEELYYFIKLKKLYQSEKTEAFKSSRFYKNCNVINIILVGILTYGILSVFILSNWQDTTIQTVSCNYGNYIPENKQITISQLKMHVASGEDVIMETNYLFQIPEVGQKVFLGRDFLFQKIFRVKLDYDNRPFWTVHAYAALIVFFLSLGISFMMYHYNKHLTKDGLTMIGVLLSLGVLYFIVM